MSVSFLSNRKVFLVGLCLLLALAYTALAGQQAASAKSNAGDIYVSVNGSDSNDGSKPHPFKTIVKASTVVQPGGTVHVAPGIYPGGFTTRADGTADARIRYISDVKWGAKIAGGGYTPDEMGWWNRGDYVDIDGFEIDGSDSEATSWWIGFYGSGFHTTFVRNKVHDILVDPAAYQHAYENEMGGAAIDMDNWYGDVDASVIGNIVYNIGPSDQMSSLVHGIYQIASGDVADNLVYNVVGNGITLWHKTMNINIINNTIDNARNGAILVGSSEPGYGDYITVKNNICTHSLAGLWEYGDTGTHNVYENNLVYDNTLWNVSLQNGSQDVNTLVADPMYVNPAQNNFRLRPDSPAIDSGTQDRVPGEDIRGVNRPRRARASISARTSLRMEASDNTRNKDGEAVLLG